MHEPVPESGDWKIGCYARPGLREGELETPDDAELVPPPTDEERPAVKQLYVRKTDVQAHGPTTGCYRCRMIHLDRHTTTPHNDECRARFARLLMESEQGAQRVQRAEARVVEETARRGEALRTDRPEDGGNRGTGTDERPTTGGVDIPTPAAEARPRATTLPTPSTRPAPFAPPTTHPDPAPVPAAGPPP